MRALILAALLLPAAAFAQTADPAAPVAAASAAAPQEAPQEAPQDEATGKDGALLASHRNYLDPAERDAPIVCKPGDLERHPGKSLGQVFGADWPAHAAPATSGSRARPLAHGKLVWPRGMEGKTGLIVMAVLVGVDGKPLRAEPLCATATGFDMAARREAMGASYAAAVVDGQPVVSPAVRVIRFLPPRRNGAGRPRPATDD